MKKLLIALFSAFFTAQQLPANPTEVVAAVLIMEARGEGRVGMEAVMSVIDNRAKSRPDRYVDVVTKKKQFSCLNEVTAGRMPIERFVKKAKGKKQWEVARRIVLRCRAGLLADRTLGADHYHASHVEPYWADPKKATIAIGKHLFYKL